MSEFITSKVAFELVESLPRVIAAIAVRDPDMARQLRKSGPSVYMNIEEGRFRRGKDRLYHYSVAAGSAGEVKATCKVAMAMLYVDAVVVERSNTG